MTNEDTFEAFLERIHQQDVLKWAINQRPDSDDFDCFFDRENLPADTDRMELVALHVPLCVSVASNVPGYEAPQCFVTNGDSNNLVTNMMKYLETISDAAFKSLKRSYKSELDTN